MVFSAWEEVMMVTLVVLQKDLRLYDNPALFYALAQREPIIVAYLEESSLGEANRWWVIQSLKKLQYRLNKKGVCLIYWAKSLDQMIDVLRTQSIHVQRIAHNGCDQKPGSDFEGHPNLLHSNVDYSYKICTAFWRNTLRKAPFLGSDGEPFFEPVHSTSSYIQRFFPISEMKGFSWWDKLEKYWNPGEEMAQITWKKFLKSGLHSYKENRDILSIEGTSMLSPHLRFGEISIRQIWEDLQKEKESDGKSAFINEIAWREFSYHVKEKNPDIENKPIREEFAFFPWNRDEDVLTAWKKGRTGIPIVDAGMRQLWETGWMHNRARMITASFLVKHLLQPWVEGAKHFMNTLVDGDVAINSTNWQWVSGCGTDSAPYFRIFNPTLQGHKFDSEGTYVRKWVEELRHIKKDGIQDLELDEALYPRPIIDLQTGRNRALEAFSFFTKIKK
jgi:deoxyribodipyrimidine photo-lyase